MARFDNGRLLTINGAARHRATYWHFGNEAGETIPVYMTAPMTDHFRFVCEVIDTIPVYCDGWPTRLKRYTKKLPEPDIQEDHANYYECAGISIAGGTPTLPPHDPEMPYALHLDLCMESPFLEVDQRTCHTLIRLIDKLRGDKPAKRPFFRHHHY